ncbi:hypothetical protein F7725_016137 [Dissostichus mawsoni]|uniref:Uncharacterized protein n=1 Tax=Dissostichus mawsoni TaxID=36200 RepID=A0A7J5Y5N2_DISMA|nr:hypothetical protein F7725_016137 [Dissostichus mawsoni]
MSHTANGLSVLSSSGTLVSRHSQSESSVRSDCSSMVSTFQLCRLPLPLMDRDRLSWLGLSPTLTHPMCPQCPARLPRLQGTYVCEQADGDVTNRRQHGVTKQRECNISTTELFSSCNCSAQERAVKHTRHNAHLFEGLAEFAGKDEDASLKQHAGVELEQVPHIYCDYHLRWDTSVLTKSCSPSEKKHNTLTTDRQIEEQKDNTQATETHLSFREMYLSMQRQVASSSPSSSNSPSSAVASWYCWYSDTKSFMLLSASVNSISSMPSPVYQWRKALRRNMAVNCSEMRLNSSWMAVLFPMKAQSKKVREGESQKRVKKPPISNTFCTLGEGTTLKVFMIRSGYSSRILLMSSVPIPEPVPPPRECVSWKPCRQSQLSASFLTTSMTESTSSAPSV